jgi:hypothetical protein
VISAALLSAVLAAAPAAADVDPLGPPPGRAGPPAMTAPRPSAAPAAGADPLAAPRGVATPPPQRLPPGARGGALRVAVVDPDVTGDVPPRPRAAFAQTLVPEIRKLEGVSVIGMAEIRDMLGFERQRQMLGCSADEGCLAEIAGALGVDELVNPRLVLSGRTYTLTISRLDPRKARVIQTVTRTFDRRDGEELLQIVGPTVAALYPDRALRAGKTRGVEREVVRRLNPPPLPRWAFVATSAAAVGSLGGAGVFHYLAGQAKSQYDGLVTRSQREPIPAADVIEQSNRVRSAERTRNALLLAGLGLGVAAGVEAFFTDWHGDRAALREAPARVTAVPVPMAGGGGVALAGTF